MWNCLIFWCICMRNMIWDKYIVENIFGAIKLQKEYELCVMKVKGKISSCEIEKVWGIEVILSAIELK